MVAFFQIRCSCPGPVRTDNEFLKSLKIRPPLPDLEFLGCEKRPEQIAPCLWVGEDESKETMSVKRAPSSVHAQKSNFNVPF
jgi:hypothetical protein